MDRVEKSFVLDHQDGAKMDSYVQVGYRTASGGDCATTGDQSKFTASTAVEGTSGDKFITEVGAIVCLAFSLNKCNFGFARCVGGCLES
jgi:alpha-D-ribose 1-methylphosphonate 5-triphosphate synthase subunit PhnL